MRIDSRFKSNLDKKRKFKFLMVATLLIALIAVVPLVGCSGATISDNSIDPSSVTGSVSGDGQDNSGAAVSQDQENQSDNGNVNSDGASGKVVVIDAGHQAHGNSSQEPVGPGASETKAKVSSGTSGRYSGVPEYQVNLQIAQKLQAYLESKGVTVVMVRQSNDVDISNSERAAIANSNNASLFVRIHCDGSENSSRSGFSTLVPGSNQWTSPIVAQSKVAGQYVQSAAIAATGANDLGIVERTDLSGFNWCEVPTILCECGFMTNQNEDMLLTSDDYQQKIATGIGNGVIQYLQTI